jgi:hypothetical protein
METGAPFADLDPVQNRSIKDDLCRNTAQFGGKHDVVWGLG